MDGSVSSLNKHLRDQFYDCCGCFSIDEVASNEELIPIVESIEWLFIRGSAFLPLETEFDRFFRAISFLERRRNPILARKKAQIQETLLRLKNVVSQMPLKEERKDVGLYV